MAVLASGDMMGQQRYEREVLDALHDLGTPDLNVGPLVVRSLRSTLPGTRRLPLSALAAHPGLMSTAAARWVYRGADLVHRCDMRLPRPSGVPEVLTVHDLAFLHFADEGGVPREALSEVRSALVVLTPSRSTADEVLALVGHPDVRVAHNGVDPALASAPPLTAEQQERLGLPPGSRYVLHSGGCTERKNLPALAQAWSEVARALPRVHLVLTGPTHPRRTALFGGLPQTRLVGLLPRRVHLGLLRGAAAVVVPSRYEGFGLPLLEGMAAGVPVVTTDRASLPEIAGAAALVVGSGGPALAAGLLQVLTEPAVNERLRAAGPSRAEQFTWEASARVHLQAYRDALAASA